MPGVRESIRELALKSTQRERESGCVCGEKKGERTVQLTKRDWPIHQTRTSY